MTDISEIDVIFKELIDQIDALHRNLPAHQIGEYLKIVDADDLLLDLRLAVTKASTLIRQ